MGPGHKERERGPYWFRDSSSSRGVGERGGGSGMACFCASICISVRMESVFFSTPVSCGQDGRGSETNFALQLKGWRENMENFCGSKPPEGGCGSRQAQGFYPLWQPTASVFHGNRRFADCDPIAQFDRFDPRTTIGLPLEVRAVSRALDFLIPVSEALPQRGTRDSNPQPRVPTRSQNRKRPNAQSHRANGGRISLFLELLFRDSTSCGYFMSSDYWVEGF
ncbi:Lipoprotein signal peptidase [Frankliniella fusca]|uniref:Lipoprotein signal peptidase n=1 Tax=Frankliniella fusca TaxID=407009 RepID=A0AAE1HV65_9NEOP|nr:Lipoprotein signal peptidase [Frankliniella fusca]